MIRRFEFLASSDRFLLARFIESGLEMEGTM
jgi:hypothetical protein